MSDATGSPDYAQPDDDEDVPQQDAAVTGRPDLEPDTQEDVPLDAEIGDAGQGDLGEGDDRRQHSGDAPDDLRTEAPSGEVREEQS